MCWRLLVNFVFIIAGTQDCLSGDGKTLMLVNISPCESSVQETTCSLRFASQVIQTNK